MRNIDSLKQFNLSQEETLKYSFLANNLQASDKDMSY